MKQENMDKLVKHLSNFIKTGNQVYDPTNTQYSWYLDIFLDESLHIDSFCGELIRRLIANENIIELDNDDNTQEPNNQQQKRYNKFYNTWYSWSILYDELQKRGQINH